MQSARLREPGGHILTQLKDEHEMLLKTGDKDAAVQRKVVRIVVRANVPLCLAACEVLCTGACEALREALRLLRSSARALAKLCACEALREALSDLAKICAI